MILAGGTGGELSVLTRHRAKTALPFGGRYRIIDFCLSNCVHSGINEISILAQYSPTSLLRHIRMGKPWDLDRKSGGVYILQPTHHGEAAQWYLGTADALYQNIDVIRNSKGSMILVLSGDQVYVMDYRELIDRHLESGKQVTIALKEVHASQRSRFGMVMCSRDGLVTSFREKPEASTYRYASLGIYLFNKEFLLDALGPDKIDIVFDIIIPMLGMREVAGYKFEGYWEDIGSITSYYRASMRLLKDRSLISTDAWPIFTRGTDLPPARFSARSSVTESIVADGCSIKGKVNRSILFPGVSVEAGATVENSIIFSYSKIGRGVGVRKSIIDKQVNVGTDVRVGSGASAGGGNVQGGRKGNSARASGITVVGEGARITKKTEIPRGSLVDPRETVGPGTFK